MVSKCNKRKFCKTKWRQICYCYSSTFGCHLWSVVKHTPSKMESIVCKQQRKEILSLPHSTQLFWIYFWTGHCLSLGKKGGSEKVFKGRGGGEGGQSSPTDYKGETIKNLLRANRQWSEIIRISQSLMGGSGEFYGDKTKLLPSSPPPPSFRRGFFYRLLVARFISSYTQCHFPFLQKNCRENFPTLISSIKKKKKERRRNCTTMTLRLCFGGTYNNTTSFPGSHLLLQASERGWLISFEKKNISVTSGSDITKGKTAPHYLHFKEF